MRIRGVGIRGERLPEEIDPLIHMAQKQMAQTQ